MRFLLEIEFIDAQKALAMGMVGSVSAAENFDEAFVAYCEKIAQIAPLAATPDKGTDIPSGFT